VKWVIPLTLWKARTGPGSNKKLYREICRASREWYREKKGQKVSISVKMGKAVKKLSQDMREETEIGKDL
jgi:hypothetical protein